MSGINRFMKPIKANNIQTYVSQYIPQPLELMQRHAETQQKKNDALHAQAESYKDFLNVKTHSGVDRGELEDYQRKINSQIEAIVDQGDIRGMDKEIRALGLQIGEDYRSGPLSRYVASGVAQQEKQKWVKDSQGKKLGDGGISKERTIIADDIENLWHERGYTNQDGNKLTHTMRQSPDIDDAVSKISKQIKTLNEADVAGHYIETFGGYMKFMDTNREGVKLDRAQTIIAAGLAQNSDIVEEAQLRAMVRHGGQHPSLYEPDQTEIEEEIAEMAKYGAMAAHHTKQNSTAQFHKDQSFAVGEASLLDKPAFQIKTHVPQVIKPETVADNVKNVFTAAYNLDGTKAQEANLTYTNALKGLNGDGTDIIEGGVNYGETIRQLKSDPSGWKAKEIIFEGIRRGGIPVPDNIQGTDYLKFMDAVDQGYKMAAIHNSLEEEVMDIVLNEQSKTDQKSFKEFDKSAQSYYSKNASKINSAINKDFAFDGDGVVDGVQMPRLNELLNNESTIKLFIQKQAMYEDVWMIDEEAATTKALRDVIEKQKNNMSKEQYEGLIKNETVGGDLFRSTKPKHAIIYNTSSLEDALDDFENVAETHGDVAEKITKRKDALMEERMKGLTTVHSVTNVPRMVTSDNVEKEWSKTEVLNLKTTINDELKSGGFDSVVGHLSEGGEERSFGQMVTALSAELGEDAKLDYNVQWVGDKAVLKVRGTNAEGKVVRKTLIADDNEILPTYLKTSDQYMLAQPTIEEKAESRLASIKQAPVSNYKLSWDYQYLDGISIRTSKAGAKDNATSTKVVYHRPNGEPIRVSDGLNDYLSVLILAEAYDTKIKQAYAIEDNQEAHRLISEIRGQLNLR